jgi:N-acetylglutamate synthase-like GNAT family acetyltransferase
MALAFRSVHGDLPEGGTPERQGKIALEIRDAGFKIAGMSSFKFQARRATLDDLPRLKELWAAMRIPANDLDRQLTDFQVAVNEAGQIVGCVALQMNLRHALIHGEAFEDFSLADPVRPVLWARIQTLAVNHGLLRLWTLEQAPFWSHNGFQPVTKEALEKMPSPWDRTRAGWLTMQLRDEQAFASLDKEFAMFVESEKGRSAQSLRQARMLKTFIMVIVGILILGMAAATVFVFVTRVGPGSGPR